MQRSTKSNKRDSISLSSTVQLLASQRKSAKLQQSTSMPNTSSKSNPTTAASGQKLCLFDGRQASKLEPSKKLSIGHKSAPTQANKSPKTERRPNLSRNSSAANNQIQVRHSRPNQQQQQQQQQEEEEEQQQLHCDDHRKQNHCEIEKRRRDKMNHYIMELASLIPSFTNNQSKFDKLTVLRMAVQHVKSLRSSLCSFSSFHLRPSFLSSGNVLKNLILQMASQEAQDSLFMVVTCDRGKVLFVSQSSKDILCHDQNELVGQCLFDILHKDDVLKVKEQISYSSLMPREMLVDSKTLQPIKHLSQRQSFDQLQNQSNSTPQPGARRSFFCRMKSGRMNRANIGDGQSDDSSLCNTLAVPSTGSTTEAIRAPASQSGPTTCRKKGDIADNQDRFNRHGTRDNLNNLGLSLKQTLLNANPCEQANQRGESEPTANKMRVRTINSTGDSNGPNSSSKSRKKNHSDNNPSANIANQGRCSSDDGVSVGKNNSRLAILPGGGVANELSLSNTSKTAGTGRDNSDGSRNCSSSSSCSSGSSSSRFSCSGSSSSSSSGSSNGSSSRERGSSASYVSRGSSSGIASCDSQTNRQSVCGESSPSNDTSCGLKRNSNGNTKTTSPASGGRSHSSNTGASVGSKRNSRYTVMHCTGYLKSITLRNDEFDDDDFEDCNSENNDSDDEENDGFRTIDCLVAVCRRSPMDCDLKPDRPLTFTCRYSMEGKFVFADHQTTLALGYTPQQLLGTSHYAYCHKDSVNTFKECHRQSILKSERVSSDIYQFKRANGQHLWLQTSLKSFRNPWTKFIDYIVANHTTAEGNDPHYNGCVPTKFNRDMAGEVSQLSSPASSSSISLTSIDSKKSSSPGSSSIGSSYSMDSYASGGSIQALLNQIDRVKSGGIRHALDFDRRRGDRHSCASSCELASRRNEDSGACSDPSSCSPVSSQNSTSSTEYTNGQGINNFIDSGPSANVDNSQATLLVNPNLNGSYGGHKMIGYRSAQNQSVSVTGYQQTQLMRAKNTNPDPTLNSTPHSMRNVTRTRNSGKPSNCSLRQHQRYHANHHYRSQPKSQSSTSSDTGNESANWTNSSGSVYSSSSSQQSRQSRQSLEIVRHAPPPIVCSVPIQNSACQPMDKVQRHSDYAVYLAPMNQSHVVIPAQVSMQSQVNNIGDQVNETYSDELMSMTSYMNQDVGPGHNNDVNLNQMPPMNRGIQPTITMTLDQQNHSQIEQSQPQASNQAPAMYTMPMVWSTAETPYQNLNSVHNGEQICSNECGTLMNMDVGNSNNQMIAQQTSGQCQQCVNHKCLNQQLMMSNSTDLNSINLTSLAVDGDLEEDQLLEYLAGCDPEAQLYHIQNNAFPSQYNTIYR